MALSQDNKALWSDVSAIYANLNSVRGEHSMSAITIPANTDKTISRTQIVALQSAINVLHSESHLTGVAQTSITLPAVGDTIRPGFITTMNGNINRMSGVCHFGFGDCNRCNGFRDSGGFN